MHNMDRTRTVLCGVCFAALFVAKPSYAQDVTSTEDETASTEIVVTANKRKERIQDVPMSISALTGDTLRDRGVTNALDLNNISPSLRVTSGDAAANPKIFIRGAGLSDFNPSSSSGVGIYADGVYVGSPLAQLSGFYDIARIEVLRGPQGTLYGRNTTGGAINVITNRPTDHFTGNVSAEYSERNTFNMDAAISGPVTGNLAFRVSGQYARADGYTLNRVTGHMLGVQDRYAVRGQLLYTPASNAEFLLQGSFFRNRGDAVVLKHRALLPTDPAFAGPDGLCSVGNYNNGNCTDALGYADTDPNPYSVESNVEGKDKVDVYSASLTSTIGLGGVDLIGVTAYQDAWRDDMENTDASPLQMLEAHFHTVQREFSQEVRVQSRGQSQFRWVLGAYYMRDYLSDNSSFDVLRELRPLFMSEENPTGVSVENSVGLFNWPYIQKVDSYALFSQFDYDITPKLTLTGGLRWSADKKSMNYKSLVEGGAIVLLSLQDNRTFSDWSGRAALSYKLSDTARVYATYNRGYKAGGFFGGFATDAAQLEPYDNETVNAYETGLKAELFGRRIRTGLSAFYYDYHDQQVFSLELRNGITTQILTNAARSRAYGGELEISGEIAEDLKIDLSAGYLQTRIVDYLSSGPDYTGNSLQHAPNWTLSAALNYQVPLPGGSRVVLNGDVNWRSRVFFDNSETPRLSEGAKTQVNGQIGWRSANGTFEAGAFVKNLTNAAVIVGVSPIESLGVDVLNYGSPRRIGGYARLNF